MKLLLACGLVAVTVAYNAADLLDHIWPDEVTCRTLSDVGVYRDDGSVRKYIPSRAGLLALTRERLGGRYANFWSEYSMARLKFTPSLIRFMVPTDPPKFHVENHSDLCLHESRFIQRETALLELNHLPSLSLIRSRFKLSQDVQFSADTSTLLFNLASVYCDRGSYVNIKEHSVIDLNNEKDMLSEPMTLTLYKDARLAVMERSFMEIRSGFHLALHPGANVSVENQGRLLLGRTDGGSRGGFLLLMNLAGLRLSRSVLQIDAGVNVVIAPEILADLTYHDLSIKYIESEDETNPVCVIFRHPPLIESKMSINVSASMTPMVFYNSIACGGDIDILLRGFVETSDRLKTQINDTLKHPNSERRLHMDDDDIDKILDGMKECREIKDEL